MTSKKSWMWKFMQELQTVPRRMSRTASKQTKLEIYSSNRHRVHQACQWMYFSLVLQVHATLVVYYPLDGIHTDYSTTSKQNTNAQLLDFNTYAWVIDILVHNMKLALSKLPHMPRLQHLGQPPEPSTRLAKPHLSPTVTPCLMLPNQPLSSALQMPPLTGVTHFQPLPRSSGTPSTLSPSP